MPVTLTHQLMPVYRLEKHIKSDPLPSPPSKDEPVQVRSYQVPDMVLSTILRAALGSSRGVCRASLPHHDGAAPRSRSSSARTLRKSSWTSPRMSCSRCMPRGKAAA
eukprot:3941547-Rhodomonas_salina.3